MIDPYLVTAPILLLGIVALLRFVGCVFHAGATGIIPTTPTLGAPTIEDGKVTLTWTETDQDTASYSYQVNRSNDGGAASIVNTVTGTTYADMAVTNGTIYTYTVTVVIGSTQYGTSNAVTATPVILPGRPPGSVWDPGNALSANLIGLFLMNEGTETAQGTPAQDKNLVDQVTATPVGTAPPTWEVADPSILFNGGASLNSYLDAGVDALFNDMTANLITIVAKVFVNGLTQGGICEKNDGKGPQTDSGFIFAMDNTGALRVTVELSNQSVRLTTVPVVVVGQWMQLAFTWDNTQYNGATVPSTAMVIYANQQVAATDAARSQGGQGTLNTKPLANTEPFRIGNVSYDFPGSLNGKIAYMAVYKGKILTSAEMATLDAALPIEQA